MFYIDNAGIECVRNGLAQGKIAYRSPWILKENTKISSYLKLINGKIKRCYSYQDEIVSTNPISLYIDFKMEEEHFFAVDWIVTDEPKKEE